MTTPEGDAQRRTKPASEPNGRGSVTSGGSAAGAQAAGTGRELRRDSEKQGREEAKPAMLFLVLTGTLYALFVGAAWFIGFPDLSSLENHAVAAVIAAAIGLFGSFEQMLSGTKTLRQRKLQRKRELIEQTLALETAHEIVLRTKLEGLDATQGDTLERAAANGRQALTELASAAQGVQRAAHPESGREALTQASQAIDRAKSATQDYITEEPAFAPMGLGTHAWRTHEALLAAKAAADEASLTADADETEE